MNFADKKLAKKDGIVTSNFLKLTHTSYSPVVPSLSVKLCSNEESINKYEEEI